MNQPEASPSNNADAGRGLSEGLGPLPEPDAWLCVWGDEHDPDRARQWHDLSDPMPEQWDDPPNWVVPHFSARTVMTLLAAERVRTDAAMLCIEELRHGFCAGRENDVRVLKAVAITKAWLARA